MHSEGDLSKFSESIVLPGLDLKNDNNRRKWIEAPENPLQFRE